MAHGKWSEERRKSRNKKKQMIYGHQEDDSLEYLLSKKDNYGKKEKRS